PLPVEADPAHSGRTRVGSYFGAGSAIVDRTTGTLGGRICHVGQSVAAHRATGAGAGADRLAVGADRASGRRLWRRAGPGRGTAVVARSRASVVQRHPQ